MIGFVIIFIIGSISMRGRAPRAAPMPCVYTIQGWAYAVRLHHPRLRLCRASTSGSGVKFAKWKQRISSKLYEAHPAQDRTIYLGQEKFSIQSCHRNRKNKFQDCLRFFFLQDWKLIFTIITLSCTYFFVLAIDEKFSCTAFAFFVLTTRQVQSQKFAIGGLCVGVGRPKLLGVWRKRPQRLKILQFFSNDNLILGLVW